MRTDCGGTTTTNNNNNNNTRSRSSELGVGERRGVGAQCERPASGRTGAGGEGRGGGSEKREARSQNLEVGQ